MSDDDTRPGLTFVEALDRVAPKPKPPTRAQRKFIEDVEAIRLKDAEDADRAFMARTLVQCTLPHRDPGDVPQWARTSGRFTLGIQPGRNFANNVSIGYPYGVLPRLLLFWVCSEAVRTGERRLQLGESCAAFMRVLGLNPSSGGKRGAARRFREQSRRLFAASFTFESQITVGTVHGERRRPMNVADDSELWWDTKAPAQAGLWESWIELGEKFFKEIIAAPVPVDIRSLKALKRSPLALDLYALLTYKTFVALTKNAPQKVKWRWLMEQFGTDIADPKNLKRKVNAALRKVQGAYPDLKLTFFDGGFLIHPSKPAIAPAARRRLRPAP